MENNRAAQNENTIKQLSQSSEQPPPMGELVEEKTFDEISELKSQLEDLKEKHLRLYAEFENYKKKAQRDREDLIMYSNESLIQDLLPVIDTLEMALTHASDISKDSGQSLIKGIENTLREFRRVLEKVGLKTIEAAGKPFDPVYHHAMSQVETEELEDNVVVEEFRKGYMLYNKILRPSYVSVSKKIVNKQNQG
ncbi:MAG: nucleotide exchange factor GrpE [Thermodesulfovibrionales bacterium]|nr:nucleotide exchange factor GrpE [Thermodesulfovibrionales bacterium]